MKTKIKENLHSFTLIKQKKQTHLSNYYHNEWAVPIAKRLVNSCEFADKVFFCNTGAEVNKQMQRLYLGTKLPPQFQFLRSKKL